MDPQTSAVPIPLEPSRGCEPDPNQECPPHPAALEHVWETYYRDPDGRHSKKPAGLAGGSPSTASFAKADVPAVLAERDPKIEGRSLAAHNMATPPRSATSWPELSIGHRLLASRCIGSSGVPSQLRGEHRTTMGPDHAGEYRVCSAQARVVLGIVSS